MSRQASSGFTPRERDVAALVARGLGNYGIACAIGLTEGTVKVYINRIYEKFDLNRDDRHARVRLTLLYLGTVYE